MKLAVPISIFLFVWSGALAQPHTDGYVATFQPYRNQIKRWFNDLIAERDPGMYYPKAEFLTCDVCKLGFPIIKSLLALGTPQETIIKQIVNLCVTLGIEREELCDPTVRSYAEPVIYIIKNRKNYTANDLCGILNPGCGQVNENLTNWTVQIDSVKPPVQTVPLLPQGIETVKILQLTDVHLDVNYTVGTNADCGLPLCCRDGVPETELDAAGLFGHYKCALPPIALDAILAHVKSTHNPLKYVFLTGDYVHSGVWLYSQEENSRNILAVTQAVASAFPNTPVYPLVGNHEPDVVNMYPPEELWDQFDLQWMYNNVSAAFTKWLGPDQLATFHKGGFYTLVPEEGLRIVVLNTNICYLNNFWLAYAPEDPNGQLQWFADTMLQAEREGNHVLILGHINPGSGSCWPVWSEKFNLIVSRFENLIRAQFYGHAHTESFKINFENGTERALDGSAYVAPSALTDGMNSGYKVYHVDGARGNESTWEIVDHETWILNTTRSNEASIPIFEKLFSARQDYALESLRGDDLYKFVLRMIEDDELFLKFLRNHNKGLTTRSTCKPSAEDFQDCKMSLLCECVTPYSADTSHCNTLEDIRNSTSRL